ncbi:hypothetical protein V6N13_008289 [Hibiscus sabdariffa]|uniref:Uncharacterized protein n=1 Tax=Hibiscus sabdariffa TaxID=183260 RepID=A0ABR2ECL2_9ROSI
MDRTEVRMQNQEAALKSLENQVGQISQALNSRPIGGFPSDIEVAKGATHIQCKAISTRSGKIMTTPCKSKKGEEIVAKPNAASVLDILTLADTPASVGEDQDIPPEPEEAEPQITLPRSNTLEDMRPPPPFPQRLKK